MAEKRYKKHVYRKKRPLKREDKDTFSEKITVQVYACVIICALMLALSKADGAWAEGIKGKIKTAINQSITFEDAKAVFDDLGESIIDAGKAIYESRAVSSQEAFLVKEMENLIF